MQKAIIIGVIGLIFVGLLALIGTYISYNNKEAVLRNQITAQIKVNTAVYDEVWKVISQQAQVTDEYKESFKDIYTNIMQGRYSGGSKDGSLMKWITEANPTFDSRLFEKLMVSIEALRAKFTNNQKTLADLKLQHDNLLDVFPGSFFLVTIGGKQKIDIPIVTSTRTENAFETRKDDDVGLFPKKQANEPAKGKKTK